MATDDLITDRPTSSTEWAEAFHNYERAKNAEAQVEAELDAASSAWHEAVPDRADEFAAYGLLRWADKSDRDKLFRDVEVRIIMRDHKGRERLTPEELGAVREEAARAADDFLAWVALDFEASKRIYGDVQERFDAACDLRCAAQDKLLTTPAPDADAMLYKLDLLSSVMAEHQSEDAESVAAIRDDARRLLGRA